MSKILISQNDPDLGHLAGAVIATDEDRVNVNRILDESTKTGVKSTRLPLDMIKAAERVGHPGGFNGVVREALQEWFDRHGGAGNEAYDARQALAVLQRIVNHMETAA